MKTAEIEIGRLIAKTVARDVSLLECASLVQEQLELIKLDAERFGYERGVREAAKASQKLYDSWEWHDMYRNAAQNCSEKILSLLTKKEDA